MKKIVYIEDQAFYGEIVSRLIRDAFSRCFHNQVTVVIIPAMTGVLLEIAKVDPDVILADLSLADSTMEATIETGIKTLVSTGKPVFILTGHEDQSEQLRVRCFEKGCSDFMGKLAANRNPEQLCERVYSCYLRSLYATRA